MNQEEEQKPKRGRIKGKKYITIDLTKGIQPSPTYVSFGDYLISNKKLNDNIISLRNKEGKNANIPITLVSNNLGSIFRKIVGNAVPSFDELSKLTEEEKLYLHKVAKKANILDKLSIPAPSKDAQEKDIHRFEVLKGEIMSGNDSDKLVREFKQLILKLMKQGLLPKAQANDILLELTEIGF